MRLTFSERQEMKKVTLHPITKENIQDCINLEEGEKIRDEIESHADFKVPFIETSAKTGENVIDAFEEIINEFISFYKVKI